MRINASRENVWDALTKPEKVKAWQYGSELTTDWKVGNEIRFKSEWKGQIFEQWGTILEFEPNNKLKYNLLLQDRILTIDLKIISRWNTT